jgi:hypothetical protein
MLDWLKHDLK